MNLFSFMFSSLIPKLQIVILSIIKLLLEVVFSKEVWSFVQSQSHKIPRYIRLLLYIYNSENPDSIVHKYVTITLLLLSGILSTLASNVLIIGLPIIGTVTGAIAALATIAIILAAMEIILQTCGDDYFSCVKEIDIKEDIREIHKILGPTWKKLLKEIHELFTTLSPIIQDNFQEISEQLESYFKNNLPDLCIYISPLQNTKIIFKKSDIKKIQQGLDSWEKAMVSVVEGATTGAIIGGGASSIASSIFVQSTLWTSIQAALGMATGIAVPASAFTLLTIGLPITLGVSTVLGIAFLGYNQRTNAQKNNLSKFLTNTTIAILPMANADGIFCEQEKDMIHQLLNNEAISKEDKDRAYEAYSSFYQYRSFEKICKDDLLLKTGHPNAKMQHIFLLFSAWEIAKIDGIIHPKEFELFERMAYILKIDRKVARGIQNIVTPTVMMQECDYVTPIYLKRDELPLLSTMDRFI